MEVTTLCAVVASLSIIPNRSQFFQYESVSMSCGQQGNSSAWRVKRNASLHKNTTCTSSSSGIKESQCFIGDLYPSDSGVYWCESGAGECFDASSITVAAGSVILESPVHPVMEGDTVTLHCRNRATCSNSYITNFYKNERLIGTSATGNVTIHRVSKLDQGLYKCSIPEVGESPDSLISIHRPTFTITAGLPEPAHRVLTHTLLPVVCVYVSLFSALLLCLLGSSKDKIDPVVVLYTDVTNTLKCKRKGRVLKKRRRSSLLSSEAEYRLVCRHMLYPVRTYKADS